jgi:hypothetical protein
LDDLIDAQGAKCGSSLMADIDLVDRYMQLVERFERLEADKKLLWHEMHTTMEAMTDAEGEQFGENLRRWAARGARSMGYLRNLRSRTELSQTPVSQASSPDDRAL